MRANEYFDGLIFEADYARLCQAVRSMTHELLVEGASKTEILEYIYAKVRAHVEAEIQTL